LFASRSYRRRLSAIARAGWVDRFWTETEKIVANVLMRAIVKKVNCAGCHGLVLQAVL
jgi:hypothetical protein